VKALDERIERAAGARPVSYTPRPGGYSTADRFSVRLADGRSVFVKSAEAENLASWIRREHEVYTSVAGDFIPRLEGWDDDGVRPVLVLEDLSEADWSIRWDAARVEAVLHAVGEIAAVEPPPGTPTSREAHPHLWGRWQEVADDPERFLSVGVRDWAWLERNLQSIIDAADSAPVDGDAFCHLDVRSDNMCFRDGRAVLVDWNWACLANPRVDVVAWLPSLAREGGPPPWEVLPDAGELVAFIAGVWAAVVGLPPPPTAPEVRTIQREQLSIALDWLDRELS
jgi:Phosphotransferase enzyme family